MPVTRPEITDVRLDTVAGGALPAAFLEQWDKVMRSIADRRTKPGAVRKVMLEVAVVADEDREEFQVTVTAEAKVPKIVAGQGSGYLTESLDRKTYEAQEVQEPRQEQTSLPGRNPADANSETNDGLPEANENKDLAKQVGGGTVHHLKRG